MTALESQFQKELLSRIDSVKETCGFFSKRFSQAILSKGGFLAVKELLDRGRASDSFNALQDAGRLDLSVEALVSDARFAPLFTDEEVNACFSLLCEADYYGVFLK